MRTSFRISALFVLGTSLLLGSVNTSQAGLIPWAYNAIFGPVGSLRGQGTYYRGYRPYANSYGCYQYPGAIYQPAYGSGCNSCSSGYTANYYTGYYPTTSYYGCNPCGSVCGSCYSGCGQGCPSGNCSSVTTPATGTTTPGTNGSTTTPTTTFKSSKPTVNPEAFKENGNKEKPGSNYDEKTNGSEGFKLPVKPEEKKPETETDAPKYNPFGSTSIETLKPLMSAPPVPVEKKPAPAEIEKTGDSSLKLVPAPIEIDDSEVTLLNSPVPTRLVRVARFSVPQVARVIPADSYQLVPPLPTPLHVAGK